MVPANTTSAIFSATAGNITSNQSATLTATLTGASQTASINLTAVQAPPTNTSHYFVQSSSRAASGTSTSLSVSFSQSTGAGDLILVGFDFLNSVTPVAVTDSQGNTFTQVGTQLNSPGGIGSRVYYAPNIKGGADTVTITLSANSNILEIYLTEYGGLNLSNPIDGQAGSSGNAGTVSSGNITTTVAGDLIYAYCLGDSSCTVGSGFVARSTLNNNLTEDEIAGNPGTYAANGTANAGWTMQAVALKPASAPSRLVILSSLVCNPTSLNSGTATTCTVTLNQPAPSGGALVGLASNNNLLSMPAPSVIVPANATSAIFSATAGNIASNQSATLTASLNGASQTVPIMLVPPGTAPGTAPDIPSSLTCNPKFIVSGGITVCKVILSQAAPSGGTGIVVTLVSNSKLLRVPPSVTVVAGSSSATFFASAGYIRFSQQRATITASSGGGSASASLVIGRSF
jgi:hypothetical protein